MIELLPDIFHTDSDRPFANEVETRAYLVTLATGNILFYSSSLIGREFDFIQSKGGILKQYLNHRDEASEYCDVVRRRFNAPLICHELERDAVSEHCEVSATFSERHHILPVLEAIPTPGHCPGSTCYLLQYGGKHILFSGDTIYPDNGVWKTYLHGSSSNVKDMLSSLDLLGNLAVDTIFPGLYIGAVSWEEVSTSRWHSLLNECTRYIKEYRDNS